MLQETQAPRWGSVAGALRRARLGQLAETGRFNLVLHDPASLSLGAAGDGGSTSTKPAVDTLPKTKVNF